MARESHLDTGVTVYKPDSITVGTFRLLPELSPMENLWRLIRLQVSVWLSKYGVYSYSKERIEDLESAFGIEIYNKLRAKVWDGSYRTDLSLYLNTRGVAWSVCSGLLKRWMRDINNDKDMLHMDWEMGELNQSDLSRRTLGDTIAYSDVKHYVSKLDQDLVYKARRKDKRRRDMLEEKDPVKKARMINEAARIERMTQLKNRDNIYHDYLSECAIYGIEPITCEEFFRRNDLDDPSPTGCSDQSPTCSQCGSSGKAPDDKLRSARNANGRRS